jgi:hypothetical protein
MYEIKKKKLETAKSIRANGFKGAEEKPAPKPIEGAEKIEKVEPVASIKQLRANGFKSSIEEKPAPAPIKGVDLAAKASLHKLKKGSLNAISVHQNDEVESKEAAPKNSKYADRIKKRVK